MRVLIVAPYFAPFSLVGSKRMVSLSKYLVSQGHDVTVWAYDLETLKKLVGKQNMVSEVPDNIKIERFHLPYFNFNNRVSYVIKNQLNIHSCVIQARENLSSTKYDVVILTCGPTITETAIMKYTKKNNIPLVLDLRDLDTIEGKPVFSDSIMQSIKAIVWYFQQNKPECKCIKHAARIVVVTRGMVDELHREYKVPKNKVKIIYNGFDETELQYCKSQTRQDDEFKIGFFGKFMYYSPRRGEMLLKAIDELRQRGIRAVLVHIGPIDNNVMDIISKLGINDDVYRSLGTMDYLDGMSIMQSMDCFAIEYCHPTGLGTKVFDYIYCNKPIICVAPTTCTLSKLVSNFEFGYSTDTIENTINALITIFNNNQTCLDSRLDVNQYSRQKQNSNYEQLLVDVVKNAKR